MKGIWRNADCSLNSRVGLALIVSALIIGTGGCRSESQPPVSPAALIKPAQKQTTLLVSAASSLTDVLNEIGTEFTKMHPDVIVHFNFAASGVLEQQIEQGAPVDVFASASPKEMDALTKKNLIDSATRLDFASNRLVLIAPISGVPSDSSTGSSKSLTSWDDLQSPAVKRVALSNPTTVPSGRYAQETLTRRGLWDAVKPKCVFGENVRQTLAYVVNGDAEAGIVFATDAAGKPGRIAGTTESKTESKIESKADSSASGVRIVAEAVPGQDHTPILYPAAVVGATMERDAAHTFVAYLQQPTAQKILAQYWFGVAPPTGKTTNKSKP